MTEYKPNFAGGGNIAMKLPPHLFPRTVAFYRDIVRLPVLENETPNIVFQFGESRLWLDCVNHFSQAEIWLELNTNDVAAAADYLGASGIIRRDEIETLPQGFEGFWICNPAGIIHLLCRKGA